MADTPDGGNDKRSAKRPAIEMRPEPEDLEDVPAPKRFKTDAVEHHPSLDEQQNHINLFWPRIFIALVPDAYNNGRFVLPAEPPSLDRIPSPLICISIDTSSKLLISGIKQKISSEHGYDNKRQILWTSQLETLNDDTECPKWLCKSGAVLFLTLTK